MTPPTDATRGASGGGNAPAPPADSRRTRGSRADGGNVAAGSRPPFLTPRTTPKNCWGHCLCRMHRPSSTILLRHRFFVRGGTRGGGCRLSVRQEQR